MKKVYIGLCLLLGTTAFANESLLFLGLPLGGVLGSDIKVCRSLSGPITAPCWVGKPFLASSGLRMGSARIPGQDTLPVWAAYGSVSLQVTRDRVLHKIEVRTSDTSEELQIINSIRGRFGAPVRHEVVPGGTFVDWKSSNITLQLICLTGGTCQVNALSKDAYLELQTDMAARKAVESKRSATP